MNKLLHQFDPTIDDTDIHVLIFCQHTLLTGARSGIQRVVIELAEELPNHAKVDYVKWDSIDGQLRFFDRNDLVNLFGDQNEVKPNFKCHQSHYRFGDLIDDPDRTWLIFPELPYHLPNGNEIFSRIISQCREYKIGTAAIFYDSIPIREEKYAAGKDQHIVYLNKLVRCDLIFPISKFSEIDFIDYFKNDIKLADLPISEIASQTIPVPLGEFRRFESWMKAGKELKAEGEMPSMIMVGTIEPRKQQTRLLKVLNDSIAFFPQLRELQVDIFGSLHPDSSNELWSEVSRNENIRYHQYAPDSVVESAYIGAWFSAFPSMHEGYGLPIVESLRNGVPCLTANFGAMFEVAKGGGCFTVDVFDDLALRKALVSLVTDRKLRQRLKMEITHRPQRSWIDYAKDIVGHMRGRSNWFRKNGHTIRSSFSLWVDSATPFTQIDIDTFRWYCAAGKIDDFSSIASSICTGKQCGIFGLLAHITDQFVSEDIVLTSLEFLAAADIVILPDETCREALIEAANRLNFDSSFPAYICFRQEAENAVSLAIEIAAKRMHAVNAASTEKLYQASLSQSTQINTELDDLAIVISTYNRGAFVELNVKWLLQQIDEGNLPVKCVVIDNTSTDDTFVRLLPFHQHPKFIYECNSSNTGMLGNLRVCSSKILAKYIWLTGDDDYIAHGAIQRTIEAIRSYPGISLLIHNFGVYHRERLGIGDVPEHFFNEIQLLAPEPSPSGIYPVNVVAEEHDNLFTAIYPLVFRSDLLATCFNYPFDGIPFGNLVECVPTTKFILETLPYADAYWFQDIGIVGNAHNSWSKHRPRWHLVLMPQILMLARDSGVDPHKVWKWSDIHRSLFFESAEIAENIQAPAHLSDPDDFIRASRFFRSVVNKPSGLKLSSGSPFKMWVPTVPAES